MTRRAYALATFNVCDLAITLYALLYLGAREANPAMAATLSHGLAPFVLLKLGMTAAICAGFMTIERRRPRLAAAVFGIGIVIYGLVLTNNVAAVVAS